jgi:hypothetical protein
MEAAARRTTNELDERKDDLSSGGHDTRVARLAHLAREERNRRDFSEERKVAARLLGSVA